MNLPSSNSPPQRIRKAIARLHQMTRLDIQTGWRFHLGDISETDRDNWRHWQIVQLNDRRHVPWSAGKEVLWLAREIEIPPTLAGYPLAGLRLKLELTWWAEDAQIYINRNWVQSGDLFDCSTKLILSEAAEPGAKFTVFLRLVSPGHDAGALVTSRCIYEAAGEGEIDPGFVGDELAVFYTYIIGENIDTFPSASGGETLSPERRDRLQELATAVDNINWELVGDRSLFLRQLSTLRNCWEQLSDFAITKFSLLGHAHLDLAWLWPVSETWEAAVRTFESVLQLQDDFPELIFCHSTPALYAWIEENRPDLFELIRKRIAAGVWEVTAGLWVEPELNTVSAESIVRQILYGQKYVLEKFGEISRVAWLPDSFGFCWQLPQLLRQGGIDYFVTQKLRWNDTTVFPYGLFRWRGLDGSEIVSLMSALIGQNIDPLKLANYAVEWEAQTHSHECLWLPGVGDHGGGPTREMLETARRWRSSPLFPELKFEPAADYLDRVANTTELPIWEDELYLEFHRGCYTNHADQKRWNRRCEQSLYRAELWASVAEMMGCSPEATDLETAWKAVLFNQFHDILPGSAIPEAYVDANRGWEMAAETAARVEEEALQAIAHSLRLPPPPQPDATPIIVFNPLNWTRSQIVSVPLTSGENWRVYDSDGNALISQLVAVSGGSELLFLATGVPSVGVRCFWLLPESAETPSRQGFQPQSTPTGAHLFPLSHSLSDPDFPVKTLEKNRQNWEFENQFIRVKVSGETGDVIAIFDKINRRDILKNPGHQLQAFRDEGQYWDAWNIDPNYIEYPLDSPRLKSIAWVEEGSLRLRLRVIKKINNSEFCQDYVLSADSPILRIENRVDWRERHILVKADFPLTITAKFSAHEIPAGTIERETEKKCDRDKAKWEIPVLNWGDLSDGNYGIGVLNDCKYGYDFQPDKIGLTLLRGSTWPDPESDIGIHQFAYGIYPHRGDWREGETVRRGWEFNQPLQVRVLPLSNFSITGESESASFLEWDAENIILMALKRSHSDPETWILRCHECHGREAVWQLQNTLGIGVKSRVNLLEEKIKDSEATIHPWEIASFAIGVNPQISQMTQIHDS